MNLDEFETDRTKILLFGPPKAGKTWLAGKLANEGFELDWLDLENGSKTLKNEAVISRENRKNVNLIPIPDHDNYPIAVQTVRTLFKDGRAKICHLHGKNLCPLCAKDTAAKHSTVDLTKYTEKKILVIDSSTQLAASAINYQTEKDRRNSPDGTYKNDWDDYAVQANLLREILSKAQVLNINIIIIAHELDAEKDEKKEKLVPQAGTRNFSKLVGKYFDEVIYVAVHNLKHRAFSSTTYSNTVLTGGRSGIKIEDLPEPSLVPFFKNVADAAKETK